ncbi:1,4-dihydroxy-2-naphthoate polyprenyltransferase [Haloprofundus salilacus]|uniref:1,4-dihydroxy-2-naphthoate polyprenyltransferase n=1 Tax=Haloprofundus salilacus TaxID=2876190 RepID=UPI001CC9B107|nr:1,4-dihydroxy-2-naphthoate polyprenyltransferase [Haloprofundus salilacus]
MSTQNISRRKAWVIAARPQTLPAAAAPVVVGVGFALHDSVFAFWPAVAALVGAALIQIGTNFANDYYDAVQGADTENREGFTRVTAGGLIAPEEVKRAMYLTFAVAILLGTYLVYVGGVPILVIGLLSVASGIAYTGGPYPLGYHGLGDVFVFVFFGLVAVTGTYYVQAVSILSDPLTVGIPAGTVPLEVIIASLPIAAISTNILVVNNIRDREEDATTGKRTLAVRYGYGFARAEYVAMLVLAYAVPVYFAAVESFSWTALLPLLTFPLAVRVTKTVATETKGEKLNPALERTGKLLAAYAVLFAVGVVLGTVV